MSRWFAAHHSVGISALIFYADIRADIPTHLQSQTELNSNANKYGIKIYKRGPRRSQLSRSLEAKPNIPSQASEEIVNNQCLKSEESLNIAVQKMNETEKQLNHNIARAPPFISNEQASRSSGQSQKGCTTSGNDQMATTRAAQSKSSKTPSISRPRYRATLRGDCQVSPTATSSPFDRHRFQSQSTVHIKDEKFLFSAEPSLSGKVDDVAKTTTVLAKKGITAATGPKPNRQIVSDDTEELGVGSRSFPKQTESTTTDSKPKKHGNKTTLPGLVAGHSADATATAPSTSKTSLFEIYNSGYIGTIQVRENIEVSLVNNENGTIKLLDLSHQAKVDLHNAGHIDDVQLW